jgi:hypothetical protein
VLLQVRACILNGSLRHTFERRWSATKPIVSAPRSSTGYHHSQPFLEQVAGAYPYAMRANTTANPNTVTDPWVPLSIS